MVLLDLKVLLDQAGQLGRRRIGGILGKRQHGVAAVLVLAAAKGRIALDQMPLAAHGARDFLNTLQAWRPRLFGLLFPTRWRLGLDGLALLDGDAASGVVTQHIKHNLADHLLEFIDELGRNIFSAFYFAQLFLPQSRKCCTFK